ncbi:hypothetical protein [Pseudoxanthomonas sacheonensis]|uniref:hypothetical protein n=1 Tax=Pseudoxanthomonas sacheonensis TaxID=443615 RepID=UPI0013D3F620|nr:hypothetical protein [Pseudoxanthomonas sacheonensis]KAF1709534.1 hypothetical protein CSC73_06280 [Pseudoxanthomonas sacheonensis]
MNPAQKSCSGLVPQRVQEVDLMSMDDVSLALVRFSGYGVEPYPKEDAARIEKEFGSERAPALEEKVRPILGEFAALKPDWSRHSLVAAAEWAGKEMKRRHPWLSEESIKAMSWIFTWRWK